MLIAWEDYQTRDSVELKFARAHGGRGMGIGDGNLWANCPGCSLMGVVQQHRTLHQYQFSVFAMSFQTCPDCRAIETGERKNCAYCGSDLNQESPEDKRDANFGRILLGLIFLAIGGFSIYDAWTFRGFNEVEIQSVKGIAVGREVLSDDYTDFIRFAVGGVSFQYASDKPNYRHLHREISNSSKLKVRYITAAMSAGDDNTFPTICSVETESGRFIISENDVKSAAGGRKMIELIAGFVFLVVGVFWLGAAANAGKN